MGSAPLIVCAFLNPGHALDLLAVLSTPWLSSLAPSAIAGSSRRPHPHICRDSIPHPMRSRDSRAQVSTGAHMYGGVGWCVSSIAVACRCWPVWVWPLFIEVVVVLWSHRRQDLGHFISSALDASVGHLLRKVSFFKCWNMCSLTWAHRCSTSLS